LSNDCPRFPRKETPMKRILLSVLLVATAGVASAQDRPAPRPARPAAGGATAASPAPRVRNYDFDADFIDGELVRPDGDMLRGRGKAEHGSLIKVRTDFVREIVKSAEDL
jgi:hypothetical protein